MKKRMSFLKVLTFLSLFSSLILSGPLYVECQDFYPDEALDFFGTLEESGGSLTIPKYHASAYYPSNFLAKTHSTQYHSSWNVYLQPFTSEPILSVPLRC
jgi:hypothetical protein